VQDARFLKGEAERENAARGLGLKAPFKMNPQPSNTNAILHNTIYTPCGGNAFLPPHIAYNADVLS
jgi:hypothetical protein